jgi:hypothetical protein
MMRFLNDLKHPKWPRRDVLRAGALGIVGLSMANTAAVRAAPASSAAKSVIYLFLSGGLAQHDSFDLKPDAPDDIRGEFRPIATRTPGIHICEHLPLLARCSDKWALVRSLTHPSNDHSLGHHIMLTGRGDAPVGFNPSLPRPGDHPAMVSIAGRLAASRSGLPAAAVLPYHLIHDTGRVIPGQFAGEMGPGHDPWLIQASRNCPGYGACPDCFDHQRRPDRPHLGEPVFQPPNLRISQDLPTRRLVDRRGLLAMLDDQRRGLDAAAMQGSFNRQQTAAWSLLTSPRVRGAFDLSAESAPVQERYGRNLFGWSCLLARRLVETGVSMVQVNLGRNETWDTHGNAFPHLKDRLLPPMDRCVSALIDDLDQRGLLATTLIVMAGEFGRTPRISHLPQHYALPGRDHWGAVQSVFFAGGGVRGGAALGSSDRIGAFPASAPQTPENLAATIYDTLGLARDAAWLDAQNRPNHIYRADPIANLFE